jgi:hypothetical protein
LAYYYPKIIEYIAAISLASVSETAPDEPAGDAQANPSRISKALELVLYLVIPVTAYAVGLCPSDPTGGTKPFVPAILKYPLSV